MQISNSVVGEVNECRIYRTVNHPWGEHAFPLMGFSCGLAGLFVTFGGSGGIITARLDFPYL